MCLREKIGPDPRNFNQRVSWEEMNLRIRTFIAVMPLYKVSLFAHFLLSRSTTLKTH